MNFIRKKNYLFLNVFKNYKILFFVFLFLGFLLQPAIMTHYSWGATISHKIPVFSLNIKDEPLKNVIKKISEATGYQITIDDKWSDLLITASLRDVSIYESMKRIFKHLNHVIIVNDKEKKLSVIIYDSIKPNKSPKKIDPLDIEVIPPQKPGERGITQRELNAMMAQKAKVDPLDIEVIPPQKPGERGITQRELNAMMAQKTKVDPLDIEVIPPRNPGEPGVTQRELNAIMAQKAKTDPLDVEVIPPQKPGERGITQRELNALKR